MRKTKNNNSLQFKKAWDLINQSQHIFTTTHEGTDGDDLGSLLAMKKVLEAMGKKVTAAVNKGVPHTLKFLPGATVVGEEFVHDKYDLVITFGCAKIARPGFPKLVELEVPIINFDHHPDNTHFGTVNVVDAQTAAVAELIYYFLEHKEIELDKDVATCLLTGIFTDTGGFKHANTSAYVLEVAAILLKKGARIDKIASYTFGQKRPEAIKVWSRALENTRFDAEKKVAYAILTEHDLEELGASDDDLQGFIQMINAIPEAKFAMLLRQDGEVIRGSLRSEPQKGVDVSEIAHSFGGGGHKLAAGFKVKGKIHKVGNKWEIK